eukprot:3608050-Rhodomonas_salina.1
MPTGCVGGVRTACGKASLLADILSFPASPAPRGGERFAILPNPNTGGPPTQVTSVGSIPRRTASQRGGRIFALNVVIVQRSFSDGGPLQGNLRESGDGTKAQRTQFPGVLYAARPEYDPRIEKEMLGCLSAHKWGRRAR